MITSELAWGGLGNQLFQYAAGRSLALRHDVNLRLLFNPSDSQRKITPQKLEISHFNIQAKVISKIQLIEHLVPDSFSSLIKGEFPKTFRESVLHYDKNFLKLGPNTRLKGYWQSERYFMSCRKVLREDFRIITPPSKQNISLMTEISSLPAVSVHIRRGDYVTNPEANAYHGTCGLKYYKDAMEYVETHMSTAPIFFVFSDDPIWVKQNFKPNFKTFYVDCNDASTSYEDLRLMAACKHNIIANSSFSWWGAWLNKSPGKIVVAPKKWYADTSINNPDMVPDDWWTC